MDPGTHSMFMVRLRLRFFCLKCVFEYTALKERLWFDGQMKNYVKSIATYTPTFFGFIISALASVVEFINLT